MRAGFRCERGVAAVFTVVIIAMLVACMALALNAGHLFAVRGELQNAADAGALAGAMTLDGTTDMLVTARGDARSWGERHFTDTGNRVVISPDATSADVDGDGTADREVDVGYWDRDTRTFTAYDVGSVTASVASCTTLPCINAVRVVTHRDSTHAGTVPVFFGGILGKATQDVGSVAVAVTGPPCSLDCSDLPIMLADCGDFAYNAPCPTPPAQPTPMRVTFHSATQDTAAWTTFQTAPGGGADLITCFIQESLANNGKCRPDTSCTYRGSPANTLVQLPTGDQEADPVWIDGGQVNTACMLIEELYRTNPDREYTVPVADVNCSPSDRWNGMMAPVDVAIVKITTPPQCTGAHPVQEFWVTRVCGSTAPRGNPDGCAGSVWTNRAHLVR